MPDLNFKLKRHLGKGVYVRYDVGKDEFYIEGPTREGNPLEDSEVCVAWADYTAAFSRLVTAGVTEYPETL